MDSVLSKWASTRACHLLAGTAADLAGGSLSDLLCRRTGILSDPARLVGIAGFLIAAAGIIASDADARIPRTSLRLAAWLLAGWS